jgi:hypothetical protein
LAAAIALVAGDRVDPAIVLRGEQEKRVVSLAWRAAMPAVANATETGRWKAAQRAMAAVIATALDMG